MQPTNISWCDYSWNPVTGCSHAGPECWNCWAEGFMRRQAGRDDAPDYMSDDEWTQDNAEDVVTTHADRLDEPLDYGYPNGPGRIFTVSMGDLFHREVPTSFIRRVVAVAKGCPAQEFVFLTKRPARAAEVDVVWPDNAIVGTSVGSGPGGEFPDTTHRIEELRYVDGRRWVSFEPLIEPVGEVALDHVDWAVVGGENAPDDDRREMDHAWARDIYRQCREQDVAFHFKQSSAATNESGTRLTVENEEHGVYEQREIREFPPVPPTTQMARGGESA
jgi:protein gp37